ncbi:MAG: aminotransferase class I/II-fold pyridoxal phosphate-dependent enzyme [Lachnospiraceae bacterium]|nr:aminotransferase class I/II-fold pyridoxal phosphate-dependent enzyme [Lachnospiraceae bacterium]
MKKLSGRTAGFTDSVIRRMTRISNRYGAINLSQGFPDFEPPKEILKRLSEVSGEDFHQYSITWGAQNFREALAAKQKHFMGIDIDPDKEIVVTCGSTEAMMAAMMTVADPGDKVIVFSPFYENYGADTILSGAEPIYVPLTPPDFTFDENVLEEAFRQGVKALILCNPSNPSGKVFTKDELRTIADLSIKYDAYVITDEVYEHIVYAPHEHVYISTLPGMRERTICCSSLSKTYSITGWRLGYTIAPPDITDRIKKVHDFLTVGAAAPLQEAVVPGLKFGQDYYDGLTATYTRKKDLFVKGLDDIGIRHTDPQGAYYVMLDISEYGYENDLDFCTKLAEYVGVGAVPGSSFFREDVNHLIRLHFAKKDETLAAALDRLADIKTKMKK